jgi:hypothetical protein
LRKQRAIAHAPPTAMLEEGKPIELKHFLVAFLDLLGQRERLRALVGLPLNLRPDDPIIVAVRVTLGAVQAVRSEFTYFFNTDNDMARASHLIPEDQREAVTRLLRSEVLQYGFSDSVVVAVSLGGEIDSPTPINGVWAALVASGWVAIMSLARGHALRGGIDVGLGVQISDSEVYGPALERAYTLEHDFAGHPRILIGSELQTYLDVASNLVVQTRVRRYIVDRARDTKRLTFIDSDGRAALDFLGEGFRSMAQDAAVKVVAQAYEFVRSERKRFAVMGNTKLSERYDALFAYFVRRATLWGLTE